MEDGKIENLFELALDVPEQMRGRSENLSAGYDAATQRWEVVLRYSGDVGELEAVSRPVTELLGGYAVMRVTEAELGALSRIPQVEYIEKPKALSYAVYDGIRTSCIRSVQLPPFGLTGRGVYVGIVDSGIDIFHPDFRNGDGSTRIAGIWDQTDGSGQPPEGYPAGTFYSREDINRILEGEGKAPAVDISGHGTHVAGIAAGNGRASGGENRGAAYESELLVVKLGGQGKNGFPQTTELMMGVDFCVKKAVSESRPIALNLSYGNNYGAHDGTSLLETYLDSAAGVGKTTICVGSGNEGNRGRHASGTVQKNIPYQVEFAVAPGETSLSIQIWKNYADRFQIVLSAPSGSSVVLTENIPGSYQYVLDGTEILWYFGEPVPYSKNQEIYAEFLPRGVQTQIQNGIWKLNLEPEELVDGKFEMWMPGGSSVNPETEFLVPDVADTLTIPSTALKVLTVAAYDSFNGSLASFSGRGAVCCSSAKPDIAAPGVNILSCAPGGGYAYKSGTSMACPFVAGSAALLMQYGIVEGRDPYLYGQKVKAYLIRGAGRLGAYRKYPNADVGWGTLCLKDSMPG